MQRNSPLAHLERHVVECMNAAGTCLIDLGGVADRHFTGAVFLSDFSIIGASPNPRGISP